MPKSKQEITKVVCFVKMAKNVSSIYNSLPASMNLQVSLNLISYFYGP